MGEEDYDDDHSKEDSYLTNQEAKVLEEHV